MNVFNKPFISSVEIRDFYDMVVIALQRLRARARSLTQVPGVDLIPLRIARIISKVKSEI